MNLLRSKDQLDNYIAQDRESILNNYDAEERDIIEALPLDKLKEYHANNIAKQKVAVDTACWSRSNYAKIVSRNDGSRKKRSRDLGRIFKEY